MFWCSLGRCDIAYCMLTAIQPFASDVCPAFLTHRCMLLCCNCILEKIKWWRWFLQNHVTVSKTSLSLHSFSGPVSGSFTWGFSVNQRDNVEPSWLLFHPIDRSTTNRWRRKQEYKSSECKCFLPPPPPPYKNFARIYIHSQLYDGNTSRGTSVHTGIVNQETVK